MSENFRCVRVPIPDLGETVKRAARETGREQRRQSLTKTSPINIQPYDVTDWLMGGGVIDQALVYH